MKNSAASPLFSLRPALEASCVIVALSLLAAAAVAWCYGHGYILYYGDAQAHLAISRSLIDSRTPGYSQLGTVWLPVLHVLCLPFVSNDHLRSTGLAGSFPVAACFVVSGVFFYYSALEIYRNSLVASVVLACFALNPNVLYLATLPMTELVFFAGLAVLLFSLCRFASSQNKWLILLGVIVSWWMSLTRYDGWFLIPFAALGFALLMRSRRLLTFVAFASAASLAPAYWIIHNWWETSNPLDFFNGPYSAAAIQGSKWYPGYHNWLLSLLYYFTAGGLCTGLTLLLLGLAGFVVAAKKRLLPPILFLLLTPLFYVWSMHSSASPIYVPQLWPDSYYNTRYGIAVVAPAALGTGALALVLQPRWKTLVLLLPLISLLPWLLHPSSEAWICWKESQVNSVSRRDWTSKGAEFLAGRYQNGQGILASSGDVTGIFCRAGIPLRETLNIGNGPAWFATLARPDLIHSQLWAVAQSGDSLSRSLKQRGSVYQIVDTIRVSGAPALEFYKRHDK